MRKFKNYICTLYILLSMIESNLVPVYANENEYIWEAPPTNNYINFDNPDKVANRMGEGLEIAQTVLNALMGIGCICCIAAFLVTAFKLGAMNSRAREDAMKNLWLLAGLAVGFGAIPLITTLIVGILSS